MMRSNYETQRDTLIRSGVPTGLVWLLLLDMLFDIHEAILEAFKIGGAWGPKR